MSQKLKELYEHPFFHGIIWYENLEEAYKLCQKKMEETGKSYACIFFLLETQDKLSLKIHLYQKGKSKVPIPAWYPWIVKKWAPRYNFVERRNPQDLSQLARAGIMDSINCPCRTKTDRCVRNLEGKIDQLRIPKSEKINIKKLIHILNVV